MRKKTKQGFIILAIDTSCDETAAAITIDDRVMANIVSSQVEAHKEFGGVYPILAKRLHQQLLEPVVKKALSQTRIALENVDAVAITVGPGLAPALEVGINFAKKIAKENSLRLIAVNHMEAHLLSSCAKNSKGKGNFAPQFPILGLLVSGGHTQLVLMKNFGQYELLGETVDDAAGEAFDKVAKMLDLGYPGGPIVAELAKKGKPVFDLPIPMAKSKDLNFSFSGLKTACLYKIQKEKNINKIYIQNFCASLEKAIAKSLMIKLEKAINLFSPKQIVLGGGVISNLTIRQEARKVGRKYNLKVYTPYSKKLLTDNAAMVGICAFYQAKRGDFVKDMNKLDRLPNLNF